MSVSHSLRRWINGVLWWDCSFCFVIESSVEEIIIHDSIFNVIPKNVSLRFQNKYLISFIKGLSWLYCNFADSVMLESVVVGNKIKISIWRRRFFTLITSFFLQLKAISLHLLCSKTTTLPSTLSTPICSLRKRDLWPWKPSTMLLRKIPSTLCVSWIDGEEMVIDHRDSSFVRPSWDEGKISEVKLTSKLKPGWWVF